eukprot:CAMPEP_0118799960 /NCGR_PEP_ID=MMETSP1161-20130426/2015_1 /TAXON_ID=249345 /ORGANISM="Picochlorum oklahomensis, Strain CCMP2329" /LENGTH=324 /DNA_ID=CAMNT_0006727733 /DNA_START=139 /DNA_END=1113 /DNA_ORIENTATION=-
MPVAQQGETFHRDNTGNDEGVNGDQRGGNDSSTRPSERMFSRVFRTPQNRPDFEQQNRGRRRPRDEGWEDSQRPISLPPTFAVPFVGSRDLSEIFSEIFDVARQPDVRVRRVRQPRTVGPLRKVSRAPSNWYLKQGQTWTGWQHVQHWPPGSSEKWNVRVVLDHVDLERGEVFGTMTATDVPGAESQVVTYFEGEMIDNENATFYSDPDASARVCLSELRHWSRFPAFRPLRDGVLEEDGRSPELAASSKVFMRWKEKCFLSGGDCRLTIAGVYYVTLDRRNGDVNAYYFDQNSAPEQRMILKAGAGNTSNQQQGYALPALKYA